MCVRRLLMHEKVFLQKLHTTNPMFSLPVREDKGLLMTVGGGSSRSVVVNGSCGCGGSGMIVILHLNAWVLPIGVRQHGVLGAENLIAHSTPELVVHPRVDVRYMFTEVTTVSDYFTTIWAILPCIV